MTPFPEAIERRVLEFIERGFDAAVSDDETNALLCAVHERQHRRSRAIRRATEGSGLLSSASDWRRVPLVPTRLFALHEIVAFPVEEALREFRSSGTTRSDTSRHFMRTDSLYRAAAMSGARWCLGGTLEGVRSYVGDDRHSSLATMANWMIEDFGAEKPGRPVAVIGTAFHFVRIIDDGHREELPAGSIVIETGGYKGRSREVDRGQLHRMIGQSFGIPLDRVVSEYGMCELSSPLWQRPGDSAGFSVPSWVKVRVVDPESLEDREEGLIAIYDPANLDSSVGILTGDVGRLENGRLILVGRLEGVVARGCSLAIEP